MMQLLPRYLQLPLLLPRYLQLPLLLPRYLQLPLMPQTTQKLVLEIH
jgi:hypothetical protein